MEEQQEWHTVGEIAKELKKQFEDETDQTDDLFDSVALYHGIHKKTLSSRQEEALMRVD